MAKARARNKEPVGRDWTVALKRSSSVNALIGTDKIRLTILPDRNRQCSYPSRSSQQNAHRPRRIYTRVPWCMLCSRFSMTYRITRYMSG